MLPLKWRRCCDEKLPCASVPRDSSQVSVLVMWGIGARLTPSANSVGTMPMTNG